MLPKLACALLLVNFFCLLSSVASLPAAAEPPGQFKTFAPLRRLSDKPVLSPRPGKFDCHGAFNPTVAELADGSYAMLYRAQDSTGVSRIGFASSKDGINFTPEAEPVLAPTHGDEAKGIEDPRLCRNPADPGEWFLTVTAYDKDAQLALYRSRDLRHWDRVGIIMPAKQGRWNTNWTKSGAIVPGKINGKYWMYYLGDNTSGGNETGIASSEDGLNWQDASERPVIPLRPGSFDSRVAEPGPPPVVTEDGILLLYNGADDKLCYRTGWALFDKNDPTKLIDRSATPIFEPEKDWEIKNFSKTIYQAPNVVFVEGLVARGGKYLIYYGAADSYVGVAESSLQSQSEPGKPATP
jgi:predicted GH43/DUF377 family glycosyl hydrolase